MNNCSSFPPLVAGCVEKSKVIMIINYSITYLFVCFYIVKKSFEMSTLQLPINSDCRERGEKYESMFELIFSLSNQNIMFTFSLSSSSSSL